MSVERLSISVPSHVERCIRAAAEAAGMPVFQWLTNVAERAASEQAALADGLAAVTEFEAENGAFTDAERARARQVLMTPARSCRTVGGTPVRWQGSAMTPER